MIFAERSNVSLAINLGWEAASGEIIIYLDDDVIPLEEWVNKHLKAHPEGGASCGCVGGAVIDKTKQNFP